MDQDLTLGRNCSTFLEYDPIKGGITFDLKLGDCDMTAKSIKTKKQKFIQFNQILSVAQKQPHNVRFGHGYAYAVLCFNTKIFVFLTLVFNVDFLYF